MIKKRGSEKNGMCVILMCLTGLSVQMRKGNKHMSDQYKRKGDHVYMRWNGE